MKITYRELRDCARLAREADSLREQIIRLRARAVGASGRVDSVPGGGAAGDPVGGVVAELTQLQERWERTIATYLTLVRRVDEAIAEVSNPDQRVLMRLRYIDGRTWEAISEEAHYSERWACELCRRGERELLGEGQPTNAG